MSVLKIRGGQKLSGFCSIQGSKNGALPLMAAAVLHKGTTILHNIPHILDVFYMIQILESLGCLCFWEGNSLQIDATTIKETQLPKELVGKMRSSIFLLGPLLGRCNEAITALPGGCSIGDRPIDLHLRGLEQMQVTIIEKDGNINASVEKLVGNEITLTFPSVGATENILMASVKAQGTTIIQNAAMEPEIVQLCLCLNNMGAKIKGIGTRVLQIKGVTELHDSQWRNQGDRIAAATYLTAVAACGGEIVMNGVESISLHSVLSALSICGCEVVYGSDLICLKSKKEQLRGIPYIRTAPFPAFPTDMQSPLMAFCASCAGTTTIEETIFEDRFQVAEELCKMGAIVTKTPENERMIKICGVPKLYGTTVVAKDLRGGAALVIAALSAEGETQILNGFHIQRGYENLEQVLKNIGADVFVCE